MRYSGLPSPLKAAYFPTFEKKISSSAQFQDKAFRFFLCRMRNSTADFVSAARLKRSGEKSSVKTTDKLFCCERFVNFRLAQVTSFST